MANPEMITIRNKRTGQVITVPRDRFVNKPNADEVPAESQGFEGILNDVTESASTAPEAGMEMLQSIPGGINKVSRYAATNSPLETLGNMGAGGVESLAGLLSAPQVLMRYLGQKFPAMEKRIKETNPQYDPNSPTFYEGLTKFEKEHGLSAQSPEEESVRNAGGLLFGGKGLTYLSKMLTRSAAMAAEQAGRGGDPVHAAILGMTGELVGKAGRGKEREAATPNVTPNQPVSPTASIGATMNAPMKPIIPGTNITLGGLDIIPKAVKKIPDVIEGTKEAIQRVPEIAGSTAANVLESAADYGSKVPVAGKAIHPTVGALASYLKHISVEPETLAQRNLFADINPADLGEMIKRDEAGKRLNITYLTPSELLNNPFEAVKQANIGRTKSGMKELYERGELREGSEEAAINKLFDLIHEDKLDPQMKAAYDATMQHEVPQDFIEKQVKKPVVQKAMKAIKNNTAYRQMLEDEYGVPFDQVPANSFMFWDMIKRVIYDFEKKSGRTGSQTEPAVYSSVRKSMVNELDQIAPEYETARSIAERKFTRKKLEDVFDKKKKNFNNFDRFLSSKSNYDEILRKLEPFPEAKQQLEDIKLFSGKMIPNNPTVRAAAALKRTGMSDARNALEAKKRELDEKYGAEHDLAAVKLMTNPDLMTILKEYLKKK